VITEREAERREKLVELLYTIREAAKELRISPWTLWDALRRGAVLRTRIMGRTFLRESELKKLIIDSRNDAREADVEPNEPPSERNLDIAVRETGRLWCDDGEQTHGRGFCEVWQSFLCHRRQPRAIYPTQHNPCTAIMNDPVGTPEHIEKETTA
jgi:hypothetical protein